MTKPTHHYKKTFEELEQVASKFWPSELSEIEANLSVIPLLLSTQDQFISIILTRQSKSLQDRGKIDRINT